MRSHNSIMVFLILASLAISDYPAVAANFKSDTDGSWTNTSGVWDRSGFPDDAGDNVIIDNQDSIRLISGTYTVGDLTIKNNSTIVIDNGASLTVNSISASNRANLFILGTFSVTNDVSVGNNDTLMITSSGSMDIGGNFSGGNNVSLDVDGSMDVVGDFSVGTGSVITGTPGAITVGGTITNGGSDLDGVLPVVLHYFRASATEAGVLLEWETLSELNNDYFTVERSENGFEFHTLSRIAGQGTTEATVRYSYIDENPLQGLSYYRLKQTDFDGTTESFRIISVQYLVDALYALKLYPNPVAEGNIRFSLNGMDPNDKVLLQIMDLSGRSLFVWEYATAGALYESGFSSELLPKGAYIVQIDQNGKSLKSRLIRR